MEDSCVYRLAGQTAETGAGRNTVAFKLEDLDSEPCRGDSLWGLRQATFPESQFSSLEEDIRLEVLQGPF